MSRVAPAASVIADQGDSAPEVVPRAEYEAMEAAESDVLQGDYQSQPVLKEGPPPAPVIEHIELFPPRSEREAKKPWIGFVVGTPHQTKNGHRASAVSCEMFTVQGAKKKEVWVGRPGSQAVPVQPRFSHLQRQRGWYENAKGTWKSVLPFGRYNPVWKARVSLFEASPTPDGKQVRIRFWNRGINGIKGESKKVEMVLDIPPLDECRGLKRIAIPVAIADALEAEDWATVAKLAGERA